MRTKIAFVLSAGKNTRLDESPGGGKAHVELPGGGTPWEKTKAILEGCGYSPYLIELSTNLSDTADPRVVVNSANGPGWAVAEAMESMEMNGWDWSSCQLVVWYGDTVMNEMFTLPNTGNYVVTVNNPPRVDRNWDWASPMPTRLEYDKLDEPGDLQVAVGIYHIQYPDKWLTAFAKVMTEPSYDSPEIGMSQVWNQYADHLETIYGALVTRYPIMGRYWQDVGDTDSLRHYEQ